MARGLDRAVRTVAGLSLLVLWGCLRPVGEGTGPGSGGRQDAGSAVPCSSDSDCAAGSYCQVDNWVVCPGSWMSIDPPTTATRSECVACTAGQNCPPLVECFRTPECLPDCPPYLGCGPCICAQCPPPPDAGGSFVAGDAGNVRVEVTTIAGSGAEGFQDGPAAIAQFDATDGLALDADDNVLIADTTNNRVRFLDRARSLVTTLAGSGVHGYLDGPSEDAQFAFPRGLAIDSLNRILVSDGEGSRIRTIAPPGSVATLAGNGDAGYQDGTGGVNGTAALNEPWGLTIDPSGNLFFADRFNNRIRRIDRSGNVTTVAGDGIFGLADGTAGHAEFRHPSGVASDGAGNLFVTDTGNDRIRRIDASGNVTTFSGDLVAGGMMDGPGNSALFRVPTGIAIDRDGNLIVADTWNNSIRRIDRFGTVTTLAGGPSPGFADGSGGPTGTARLTDPAAVAVARNGDIIFTDNGNWRIRRLTVR